MIVNDSQVKRSMKKCETKIYYPSNMRHTEPPSVMLILILES